MEQLLTAGNIAKALSAILALLALVLVRPIRAAYRHHKQERKEQQDFRREVLAELKEIRSDMGDLQYESLAQAHDFYTAQGWCPSATKEQLINMHKSYIAKGRNHLSVHYEQEIINLPEHP